MQAELFEQNAILMTTDNILADIYNDLLMVNGYSLINYYSILDVVRNVNETTKLIILDLDNENMNTIGKAIKCIKSKFENVRIMGISIYSFEDQKEYINLLDSFLIKPVHIDDFMDAAFKKYDNEIILM